MLVWSVYGQVSGDGVNNHPLETIQKHQMEITQACATTMTNIQHELQNLEQQFTTFSDIGSVEIQKVGLSNVPSYHLLYKKNVHIEYPSSQSLNSPRQTQDRRVIDKEGGELEIYIKNYSGLLGKMGGDRYSLLKIGGDTKMLLIYHLYLNSPDPVLEKAVKDIIEKHVSLLRKTLQNILGVDPAAEKAKACAPVMTNILIGLQRLAQQYPALSDIGSATIENKGPQYVYQHLHYWKNAHVAGTNDALPYQAPPPMDIPFVVKGGIALDVYIRNVDEPFGFRPVDTYILVSPDHKTQLDYLMYFNLHDKFYDSTELVKATDRAVRAVIENQRSILRKELDNIIDF
jgi:hypothetical protein